PNSSMEETVLKDGRYNLFGISSKGSYSRYWPSIKICIRNKYKIKDAGIYFDYLNLLDYFKKDLRNAKFVCPKNLNKEHDILVNRKRGIQREEEMRREEERKRLKLERDKTAPIRYAKNKKPFIGLKVSKGKIQVSFLNSIEEVKREGEELN